MSSKELCRSISASSKIFSVMYFILIHKRSISRYYFEITFRYFFSKFCLYFSRAIILNLRHFNFPSIVTGCTSIYIENRFSIVFCDTFIKSRSFCLTFFHRTWFTSSLCKGRIHLRNVWKIYCRISNCDIQIIKTKKV